MEQINLNKNEKVALSDCVAYLLQHCLCIEKSDTQRKFCLDVAEKALFLYNLCPKAFGRNKTERNKWLESINRSIEKYSSNKAFHL